MLVAINLISLSGAVIEVVFQALDRRECGDFKRIISPTALTDMRPCQMLETLLTSHCLAARSVPPGPPWIHMLRYVQPLFRDICLLFRVSFVSAPCEKDYSILRQTLECGFAKICSRRLLYERIEWNHKATKNYELACEQFIKSPIYI